MQETDNFKDRLSNKKIKTQQKKTSPIINLLGLWGKKKFWNIKKFLFLMKVFCLQIIPDSFLYQLKIK